MKTVTTQTMRELERRAMEEFQISGEELMRRAGEGVAESVSHLARQIGVDDPLIRVYAGRGNNGGDGFVVARALREEEYDVEVWLAGTVRELRGDALKHFGKMKVAGVPYFELPTLDDWESALAERAGGDIMVDAVLGTGVSGPPRGPAAGAIHLINELSGGGHVVSVDVPSGLDGDSGQAPGEAVRADLTLTMGLPKRGLIEPAAVGYVGVMRVVSLGLPPELLQGLQSEKELVTAWDLRTLFPRRPVDAHKGLFGHVLIFGGARGYTGAPVLAAHGALSSGVGLVSVAMPASLIPAAAVIPAAMVHASPETDSGSLAAETWEAWRGQAGERMTAIVAGPGMTPHVDTQKLVRRLLAESRVPLVLDADALNVLAGHPEWVASAACPVVLTPHPGELGRLMGVGAAEIQADRHGWALRAMEATRATVVLKGAGTVVAAPGQPLAVNLSGNPGMARGGMGDVLAGLIGGLLAQWRDGYTAACAGVYLHGRAGDQAAVHESQTGMTVEHLLDELPYVFREITCR